MNIVKSKRIIWIILAVWILSLVGVFFGVKAYISAKEERLRQDMCKKINDAFGGERVMLVDVEYSGKNVESTKMEIPPKPNKKDFENLPKFIDGNGNKKDFYSVKLNEWKDDYGDLFKLFRISNDESGAWHGYHEDGWSLVKMNNQDFSDPYIEDIVNAPRIAMEWIFPYAVGYKRQEYQLFYDFIPSVEEAVEEAFEFFTTNPKSQFLSDDQTDWFYKGRFERGCYQRIRDLIYNSDNDYYEIRKDQYTAYWHIGNPLFKDYANFDEKKSPLEYTYMYNGYYRVFVGQTQPVTYSVYIKPWHPEIKERNKLWIWWSIGLTILMLAWVLPMMIIRKREVAIANESLQDKLKRLCNPSNFTKPYDKDKVEKANAIYQQLQLENLNDETLLKLQKSAVTELGITLIDPNLLKQLKERVNPERYTKPYNAEKVSLANELFAKINKEGLTYEEFIEIEKESKEL